LTALEAGCSSNFSPGLGNKVVTADGFRLNSPLGAVGVWSVPRRRKVFRWSQRVPGGDKFCSTTAL